MTGAQTEVRPVGDDPSMAVNARAWSLIRAALFHHEGGKSLRNLRRVT